jgi:hypothetical protein
MLVFIVLPFNRMDFHGMEAEEDGGRHPVCDETSVNGAVLLSEFISTPS